MYVESILVKDLRCFDELEIKFSKGINVLTGSNNSGKSSILKSLILLQNGSEDELDKSDIRSGAEFCKIFIRLDGIKGEKDLFRFKVLKDQVANESFEAQTVYKGILNHNIESYLFNTKDVRIDYQNGWIIIGFHSNELPSNRFDGFSEFEDRNNFIFPFFSKRKALNYNYSSGYRSAYSVSSSLQNLLGKIKKITNPSHPQHNEFSKYCNRILGFTVGVVPLLGTDSQEDRIGIYVDGNKVIPIESMGEGVVNIIGLLTYLLSEDGKLYLIEELENDIHPKALKQLLELIIQKSSQNQFIISTHSNIVLKYLASVSESKVFFVKSEMSNTSTLTVPTSKIEEVNNAEKRVEVLSQLGYDLLDFDLYSGYLLLEESTSERIINDLLIPWFAPKLINKVRTISCGGVTEAYPRFNDFLRLFTFIHTSPTYKNKAWVVVDGDNPGKEVVEALMKKFNSWPEGHFISLTQENFEKYYPDTFQGKIDSLVSNKKDRKAKIELLEKVISWAKSNEDESKRAFEESANEIIQILREIESKLASQ